MGRFAEALEEVRRMAGGDYTGFTSSRISQKPLEVFTPKEVRAVRIGTKMPQWLFAACMGVSPKTVEAWEGGRSHPDGAARRLLGLVRDDPEFFRKTGVWARESGPWKPSAKKSPRKSTTSP